MHLFRILVCLAVLAFPAIASANLPGGIITSSTSNVTLTDAGSTVTLANGLLSIVVTKADASIHTINYTYNNSGKTVTNQLLSGGNDGGQLYWTGNPASFGTMSFTYSIIANTGTYAEISLVSTSTTNGVMEVHYSMLKGSPGFYCTPILTHRAVDGPVFIVMRPNIYSGAQFNWMSVDANRNKLMEVTANTSIAVPTGPKECYLWTSGTYQGQYEDKYKYSADLGVQRVWGWSSVGSSGSNVGLWNISASAEYYPGGPMARQLMEHIGTTILNVFTGNYYGLDTDNTIANAEVWTKVYGPYFYYCNTVSSSDTNPVQASQALYSDALAQATAEQTAWPYSWFTDSDYTPAANRGTVTGTLVISDSGNPNASAAGMWVGVVQQPSTTYDTVYDFQQWTRPYQFWVQTDSNGVFTIPDVIAGSNYTLYAFGAGAAGTFMSQAQTGGGPPLLCDLPATPFSVTVTGGTVTSLGTVTWAPARIGPTVFEIGYPDRTARKFRHGDDYWVGDIGPSPTAPTPVWTKFMEYPFDFPNGPNYIVGSSRWPTDWNFIQPSVYSSSAAWNATSSNISFTLPSGTSLTGSASLYLGLASDYYAAIIVTVNGHNLGSVSGLKATPNSSVPTTGYYVGYGSSDTSIREGVNGAFSDERLTFPASILSTGTAANTINVGFRSIGGSYFADHAMYDYLRLELTKYVPPAPSSVTAFAGNSCAQLIWPVTPGATGYDILRSNTSGSGYVKIAGSVTGPVCGSGSNDGMYVDTTATNGDTYYYVVQSVNVTGTSGSSSQAGITPSATAAIFTPVAPTGLAVSATNGAVTLNWGASTGANYYTVQRSTLTANGGGTYNSLGTITLTNSCTGTTYSDASPTYGTNYAYTVLASNAAGSSGTSASINAQLLPTAPASPPATVTATPGTEQVTLNWTAVAGATGYIVQVATTSGGLYTFLASVSSLTYTDTGKGDNTAYYYVISSVNEGGTSTNSVEVSATTAPAAPDGLIAIPGNTQVTLSWTASPAAATYTVGRGTVSGGPYTTAGTSAGTTFTDSGLTNGTTYYYVVTASNSNGVSLDSSEVSATPGSTVPIAPVLTATPGNRQVALNWTASDEATSYSLLGGTSEGGPYSSIAAGLTGTTYTNAGLSNGVTYYYVVEAADATGSGAYSNEANATPYDSAVTWSGTASAAWDTTSLNWLGGSADIAYTDGEPVIFDDTAARNTVAISGTVNPGAVTFGNSLLSYTVSGGAISGTGAVVKTGTGTVLFTNVNSYSGGTTITGGTVGIGATSGTSAAIGSGGILLGNGGAFAMSDTGGHNFPANSIQVAGEATAVLSSVSLTDGYGGAVSGPGDGTLILSGLVSVGVSGSAQFAGFGGLVDVLSGSQLRFASTSGANGNGGANTSFQVDGSMFTRNSAGTGGVVLGALSGAGTLLGQTNTATGNVTYFLGAKNIDSTFTGIIANGANGTSAITKVGTGTLTLAGATTYTGATTVSAGVLKFSGTASGSTSLTVANGAVYYLAGGSLTISGGITNNGIFKISGSPTLSLTGTFTNNGVLDLINSTSTLPSRLVNNGAILYSSVVVPESAVLSGSALTMTIQSYSQHTYQLQRAATLPAVWGSVGSAQTGDGTVLTLTDPSALTPSGFYRILVSP